MSNGETSPGEELSVLREEGERLRLDLLAARDAVRGAQAALGNAEGRIVELEAELARARRDHAWLRHQVLARAMRLRARARSAITRIRF